MKDVKKHIAEYNCIISWFLFVSLVCVCVCSAELLITALLRSWYTLSAFGTLGVQMYRAASHCNTTLVQFISVHTHTAQHRKNSTS